MSDGAQLEVRGVAKHFQVRAGAFRQGGSEPVFAVDGVDLTVHRRETVGIVGESGCGKTTLGRMIVRLLDPTAGRIRYEGRDVTHVKGRELRRLRAKIQFVFQDPYSSLNPLMSVRRLIEEPLRLHDLADAPARRLRVLEVLEAVGLDDSFLRRRPGQLSGGQRQRVGIARALAAGPQLVVCDEPVSALDVAIRAQILNLLQDLQDELGLTYILISHDLSVVRHVTDRVAVMYLGRIVESAATARVFAAPHHPYTEALLSANPLADPVEERARRRIVLQGEPPSPIRRPGGCHFHPRCPIAQDVCATEAPPLRAIADGHTVACHFAAPHPITT